MAKRDVGAAAEQLFIGFIAPLVTGGPMRPGRPIGPTTALAIGDSRAPLDIDRNSHVQLARVRVARRLAPVDRFDALSGVEWALLAALHDVVQSAHPGLKTILRGKLPRRILEMVSQTLSHVPPPASAAAALSRHSLLSRMFDVTRDDTVVSWWLGSATFLGEEPPARLQKWPELRRVSVTHSPRPLMALPVHGAAVDPDGYEHAVRGILSRSPLTDLATVTRDAPRFRWGAEALSFASTRAGKTLALRALAAMAPERVDEELGRATKELMTRGQWKPAALALDLLGERALLWAEAELGAREPAPLTSLPGAAFARAAGSFVARRWLAMHGSSLPEAERFGLLRVLEPAATTPAARELEALLKVATGEATARGA